MVQNKHEEKPQYTCGYNASPAQVLCSSLILGTASQGAAAPTVSILRTVEARVTLWEPLAPIILITVTMAYTWGPSTRCSTTRCSDRSR